MTWIVTPIEVGDCDDKTEDQSEEQQTTGDDLLYGSDEDIVDNVFEVGEKSVNRVPGWRFVESIVVPDEGVLEFTCNLLCAVDVLVAAVQKGAKEIWWLVNSNSRCSNSGTVSVATAFKNSSTETAFYRVPVLLDTVFNSCSLPWEACGDTL